MAEPMTEYRNIVCFKSAEEIAQYVGEDPKRINHLVADEGMPAWKRKGIGPWRALNIDLDKWLVAQRDKYYLNPNQGDGSK